MAQWNLDHLPDLSDLPGKAADVFIGDLPHMKLQLFQSLSGDADDGLLSYEHRAGGQCADHGQVEAVVDHLYAQHLTFYNGSSFQHAEQVLGPAHEPDLAGGSYSDLSGGSGLRPGDLDPGINAHYQVGSGVSVDPDEILGVIWGSGPGNGIYLVFSFDLHNAAVLQAQAG